MRVVILTSGKNLNAACAVESFVQASRQQGRSPIEIVGMVDAGSMGGTGRGIRLLWQHMQRSGRRFFLWVAFIQILQSTASWMMKHCAPRRWRHFSRLEELAEEYHIPYHFVEDINGETSQKFIASLAPDYIVSLHLLQIVKRPILDIPTQGTLNMHPAMVQQHRGSFSGFWALLKGWKTSGVTIHHMREQLDAGEIALQKRFWIRPNDSVHAMNMKASQLGGTLMARALRRLECPKRNPMYFKKLGQIFSRPNRTEVDRFYKKGRVFIKWQELWDI